jgi:SAM-dependent methyltransferase
MRLLESMRTGCVLKYLDVDESDVVLDVGCGCGNVLEKIVKGRLYGIDISEYAIGQAEKRLQRRATLHRCDAQSLPFEAGSFDKIMCSEVVEHTLEPEVVFGEMWRVLKPDGICVVSIPNEKFSRHIKSLLRKCRIGRSVLSEGQASNGRGATMHEWHLHCFGIELLEDMIGGRFRIVARKAVPCRLFPIKYVAKLVKLEGPASLKSGGEENLYSSRLP